MSYISQVPSVLLLVLGFGFVVFFHELGHFLAAKWAGVKVEQFAVGFGQALLSWRKGLGLRVGSSFSEYEQKLNRYVRAEQERSQQSQQQPVQYEAPPISLTQEQMRRAAAALALGETEYRLNWIPLGGYVKMLGQDDLRPNAIDSDPRAYNMKSVGKRMVIVSAGVIMNVILAIIGFAVLFRLGFNAPPAVVGGLIPLSPAQNTVRDDGTRAPLEVGDRILTMDGKPQHDFTKISLNTALLEEGRAVSLEVLRRDGRKEHLWIHPQRMEGDAKGFLMLGMSQPAELQGVRRRDDLPPDLRSTQLMLAETLEVNFGDVITGINDQPVGLKEYPKLDQAIQQSQGKPVKLTVRGQGGKGEARQVLLHPRFDRPFGTEPLQFAGILPRPAVEAVLPNSPVRGQLLPGDVIVEIVSAGDPKPNPTPREFTDWLNKAGESGGEVDITVLRGAEIKQLSKIHPTVKIPPGRYGLGILLGSDDDHAVVAGTLDDSPARQAGIPSGATISSIDGQAVSSWFDVRRVLAGAKAGKALTIRAKTSGGAEASHQLTLSAERIAEAQSYRLGHNLRLRELTELRQTDNPLIAVQWGVVETRDFILQFYLTLKRMFQGSVSYTNMMGPVGIFHAGTKLAYKGTDWLIWFLSMISANLAVVNFLPIPIVDGGLFTFLLLEKIKGKPLSPRAQSIAQVVGLALLLGVFLLVTYQDINRLF